MAGDLDSALSGGLGSFGVSDYIYGPYATGHSQSGTFYYGAYQYAPVWWRDTFNPPGFVQCTSMSNQVYGSHTLRYRHS